MPHTARLRKVGGSVMVAIPPAILETLDLKAEAAVDLTVDAGQLVIKPRSRPRYTLEELLAKCDPDAPMPEGDEEWLNSPPIGREIL